ncbi:MAG: nucleotidyltransferase domain-containing protein [Xanthobacteraceae bacterium]|jgi:predicted nucleotidyltransferase
MSMQSPGITPLAACGRFGLQLVYTNPPLAFLYRNMNSTDPNATACDAAMEFAHKLVPVWRATLGQELLGLYLIGSLTHGGFSRRYSDIDIAVITESGLSPQMLDSLRHQATALSAEWGPKVSVFWTDRQFGVGRFPPLDRLDYLDRPVVLVENERVMPARPALQDIRDYLRGPPFLNWATRAKEFAIAGALDAKDRKAYLRALLYPARLCFSYATGLMTSNDDAVAYLRERKPPGLDLDSIERALQCRRTAADPDLLFDLRSRLPAQVDACTAIVAA